MNTTRHGRRCGRGTDQLPSGCAGGFQRVARSPNPWCLVLVQDLGPNTARSAGATLRLGGAPCPRVLRPLQPRQKQTLTGERRHLIQPLEVVAAQHR
jgi:hypothetical protein